MKNIENNILGRLWLDSLTANNGITIEMLQKLISDGYTIVVANTVIDMSVFQQNQVWFQDMLEAKKIIIEIWATPDQMVSKPFFWSSCNQETAASESFEDAIEDLPNVADILDVADLVDAYGIPKGEWPMGNWAPPAPLAKNEADQLNLDVATATRTDVLNAAKALNRMDVFDAYNVGYNCGLATQHTCDGIINSDGSVTKI